MHVFLLRKTQKQCIIKMIRSTFNLECLIYLRINFEFYNALHFRTEGVLLKINGSDFFTGFLTSTVKTLLKKMEKEFQ